MAGSQTNEAPNEPRLQVGVILASVREGRRGETFANWILSMLQARPGVTAELLDLKEWPLPGYAFKDAPTVGEKSYESGSLAGRWRDRIAAEDAILVVTPEYNHSFSGALKNALDHLQVPWHHKPIAFVSYGGFAAGSGRSSISAKWRSSCAWCRSATRSTCASSGWRSTSEVGRKTTSMRRRPRP